MGFINTTYTDVVESFVKSNINIIKNPMYVFNDKKPTIVKYYNKDVNKSTLDEVSGLEYDTFGENCPSKFNLIENAVLYGIEKIQLHYELDDEEGIEIDDIAGEAYILPDTFIPYVGDYFIIPYLKEVIMFIVTEVQTDTLDDDRNFYKISYKNHQTGQESVDALNKYNTVDSFKMLPGTVGTSMKSVIRSSEYDFLAEIESSALALKEIYKQIFFKNSIQTFSYFLNGFHLYDPYMIEFLIRNNIMGGSKEYVYVDHAMATWPTFGIDYNHTFFRALELRDKEKLNKCNTLGVANIVTDIMSLMKTRIEDYFYLDYKVNQYAPFMSKIEVINNKLIDHIMAGAGLDITFHKYDKIIYDYFQDNTKLELKDLSLLDDIEDNEPKEIFYAIPILIYILEHRVKEVLERIDTAEQKLDA